jgi:stage II sporulation protein GA (sporulation sigma-E factor processing peptidase)
MLGAAIGAALALGDILIALSGWGYVLAKGVALLTVVGVAFRWQGMRTWLGHTGTFLALSFLVAGGVQGIQQLFSFTAEVATVGVLAALLVGIPMLFVARHLFMVMRKGGLVGRYCLPVEIHMEGATLSMTGFMDTGNHLYEPMTGLPVVIGMLETWSEVFPAEVVDAIRTGDLTMISASPLARKLRIVPYRSVGTGTQWLIGIRPEWLRVGDNTITQVILALQVDQIRKDGAYALILHPELI